MRAVTAIRAPRGLLTHSRPKTALRTRLSKNLRLPHHQDPSRPAQVRGSTTETATEHKLTPTGTDKNTERRQRLILWTRFVLILSGTIVLTAYISGQPVLSGAVIGMVATAYATFTVINLGSTIIWALKAPNMLDGCIKHFKLKAPRKAALAAIFATPFYPIVPYLIVDLMSNGEAKLHTHIAAIVLFTAAVAAVITRTQIQHISKAFKQHQEQDCPDILVDPNTPTVNGYVTNKSNTRPDNE